MTGVKVLRQGMEAKGHRFSNTVFCYSRSFLCKSVIVVVVRLIMSSRHRMSSTWSSFLALTTVATEEQCDQCNLWVLFIDSSKNICLNTLVFLWTNKLPPLLILILFNCSHFISYIGIRSSIKSVNNALITSCVLASQPNLNNFYSSCVNVAWSYF